nr:hypothetical protein [Tanacetum cinerariifolium]
MVDYLTKSDASEGFNQVFDFLNGSYIKYALTVNPNIYVSCIKQFWNIVAIKQVNDVTRLQALVDKKKVVVTENAIREVLWLDDAEGVDYLPNKEIFIALARMGYEKPSTKLTFYKAFFSSHWKFLIHTILQSISEEHVEDVTAAQGDDAQEPSIPFPTLPTPPPQLPQDLPSTSQVQHTLPQSPQAQLQPQPQPQQATDFPMSLLQEAFNACATLTKRVEHLQLKMVGTSQRIDTSDDTVMDDESNQRRIIDEMDKDDWRQAESWAEIYKIDMDHASKVLSMQKDEPTEYGSVILSTAEPQVPAATIIAAPGKVAAAPSRRRKGVILVEEPKPLKKKQQVKMDEEYARKLHAELNKYIDWDVAIDHVKLKAKDDPVVKRYQAMKRKPQTETQARKNMIMYLKNMEEEESRALQATNETPAEKAAKRRKLNEEVEDLKNHLEIVTDEDDDVYTEATLLARKLILLVERRYPLSRFTLDQMLNAVRLRVKEESEVSLKLLRFTRQQHQEGQHK